SFVLSFFFQAEDGIRGLYVTGVQTCALPISGYDVSLPSGANGTNLKARTDIARDVGNVDINGNVDTSTAPTDYAVSGTSGFTPAGALSLDGSGFYVYSQQVDSLRYANLGATNSAPLTSATD